MKKIGFLSFGHWANHPSYQTRSAADTLLQSIDLAVAAEEMGLDGAYFRVHHFAAQLSLAVGHLRQNQQNRNWYGCDRYAI
jgi:alkanesulfonate monooxygenase SsuD/methylene tetrahydromethanopterin reductase-like flavin-dependent oxidoreductase (luciferase family)